MALAHGTNDAQKTMGVITLTLIIAGWQSSAQTDPQTWVILACGITIALGTYMGGWRIIRTLGKGLTDVKPAQGFSAESSTAATILASSALGFALSTTQVASGSVIGSGLGRRGSTVRWRTAGRIMVGWLFTLPAAGAVGGVMALMVAWLGGWGILIDADLRRRGHPHDLPALASQRGHRRQRDERSGRVGHRGQGQAQSAADAPPARRRPG